MTDYIRTFFRSYVENSVYERPSLGDEEYVNVQTAASAITIASMWKVLLCSADLEVLQQKRLMDPVNASKWSWERENSRRRYGAIAMMNKVCGLVGITTGTRADNYVSGSKRTLQMSCRFLAVAVLDQGALETRDRSLSGSLTRCHNS